MWVTAPTNQWPSESLRRAISNAVHEEGQRRALVNQRVRSPRLATRPEAIERDVLVAWLRAFVPAGIA